MTKLSAELKTAKYIRRKSKRNSNSKVQTNSSPFLWLIHTLAASPLLALDLLVSSALWLHTMIFQLTMYGVYIGLFIFCHATGMTHKLERPPPQCEVMVEHECERSDTGEDS